MSKIFDALRKVDGPQSESVITRIESELAFQAALRSPSLPVEPAAAEFRRVPIRFEERPVLAFGGGKEAAEQYRVIRTKMVRHPSQPRVILVSSPGQGDGKTTTSANLAGSLALKQDLSVLLVDTDFRRPALADLFGVPGEPGLSDVLAGSCTLEQAVFRTEQYPNLHLLPNGSPVDNPVELLDSPNCAALLQELRARFSFVILDAPPAAAAADFDLLQELADGMVLVLRTDHSDLRHSRKVLAGVPEEKLIGVVLNYFRSWIFSKDSHGYGYYSKSYGKKEA